MASKITYEDKVGVEPRLERINQVWDADMNEIKAVVNANADEVETIKSDWPKKVTVSTLPPSGVPADGEEWVVYIP